MWFGALLLPMTAHAATCAEWSTCPVAADLHPVEWNYFERYDAALVRVMGSRRASPLFSASLNEAEAHWRLLAATGRGLDLPANTATRWRDLALAGSFLAFDQVIGETVARSDDAQAVRSAFDTVLAPSAELIFRRNGDVRLAHQTGWGVKRRFQREEEEQGLDAEATSPLAQSGGHKSPPVKVSGAVGWKLRDVDASPETPLLTWNAELAVHNAGLSLFRVDVDLLRLHWDTMARERLFDGLSLGAGLHSDDEGPTPARWSTGVFWAPVRDHVVSLQRSAPLDGESWRVDLSFRVELGTFLQGRSPLVDTSPNVLETPLRLGAAAGTGPTANAKPPATEAYGARRKPDTE